MAARRHTAPAAPAAKSLRPSRHAELHPDTIAAVIPEGRELGYAQWFRQVCAAIRGSDLNANRKASLRAVARAVYLAHNRGTGIFRAGLQAVIDAAGYAKATVNRALSTLRQWHLLATVAEGRSADYTPGKIQNDRAVWALLVPVDKTEIPLEELPAQDTPRTAPHWQHFARKACNAGEYQPMPRSERDLPLWHGHTPTSSPAEEALAVHEIQRRLFLALGKAPLPRLLPVLAPFLAAGNTIKAILHMIDHRPDGSLWPHDGATGIKNPAAWLQHRLAVWNPEP